MRRGFIILLALAGSVPGQGRMGVNYLNGNGLDQLNGDSAKTAQSGADMVEMGKLNVWRVRAEAFGKQFKKLSFAAFAAL